MLQDLSKYKINGDIQDLIKNYLIQEYRHIFPPQVIQKIIFKAPICAVACGSFGFYAFIDLTVTGSYDKTILVWDLGYWTWCASLQEVLERVQNILNQNLLNLVC